MNVLEQIIVLDMPIETNTRGEEVDIEEEEQKEKCITESQAVEQAETHWRK